VDNRSEEYVAGRSLRCSWRCWWCRVSLCEQVKLPSECSRLTDVIDRVRLAAPTRTNVRWLAQHGYFERRQRASLYHSTVLPSREWSRRDATENSSGQATQLDQYLSMMPRRGCCVCHHREATSRSGQLGTALCRRSESIPCCAARPTATIVRLEHKPNPVESHRSKREHSDGS